MKGGSPLPAENLSPGDDIPNPEMPQQNRHGINSTRDRATFVRCIHTEDSRAKLKMSASSKAWKTIPVTGTLKSEALRMC